MDRGREGRRGGGGGGLVHAPRRPRTGFKDAAVGDDGDDMMDDVHNSRLRERSKKDGGGVTSGHGVATSTVGPSSRNKRKRQGSQEVQVHARNSPADEVEETTEDTEMGVSEDDDDPPPPIIIPRRPGKPRPQAKFAEDGIAMDLPAVPRKARTAMGKRPHSEAVTPPVAESPAHGAAVAASAPAPSSTPSSSSIASLKPGRRTKPSGSKPRGHKLTQVSSASHVSEQEVEVAEALFDLARMFTQPSSPNVESKADFKVKPKDLKPESKLEMKVSKVSGGNLATQPLKQPIDTSAVASADPASAAKRKRPRVKTRTDDSTAVQSRPAPSTGTCGGVAPAKDGDQSSGRAPTAERNSMKLEKSGTTAGVSASANNVGGTASSMGGVAGPSGGLGGSGAAAAAVSQDGAVSGSVGRGEKSAAEKKSVVAQAEKKAVNGGGKAEAASSNSQERRVADSPVREKKSAIEEAAGPAAVATATLNAAVEAAPSASVPVGAATTTKMEVEKRSPQAVAVVASDVDHVPKRDIDLMLAPSKADGDEKDDESGEGIGRETREKRVVHTDGSAADAAATVGVESKRAERDREREAQEKDRAQIEMGKEKERERELEREQVETEQRRELESQRELEKEKERSELSKAGARSGKSTKAENGRVQKGERAGPGTTTSGSTFLGTVGPSGGNVAVLPVSVGMLSWPGGMAGGLGYFPTAAAAAAAAAEESSPAVQVPPYMMGPQRAAWKRCAQHVYIAHFIDMQQQLNRHQSFFTGGGQAYPKSYNLNVPLAPSESVFGGAGGAPAAGAGGGGGGGVSSSGVGGGAGALEATERGLNAAAMAAAAAASIQGVKERAYSMEMLSRKSPGQHGVSGGGPAALSLQSGAMFGFPNGQSGSPAGASGGGGAGGSGAMGGTNLNLPPGGGSGGAMGVGGGGSSGGGSSAALVLGPGAVGGGSSGVAASAAAQAQYMQAMMQQSGSFSFAQFPPHFGPATFNGPASHMSAQQAAQFFASGAPYFGHHIVAHSQQGGQQSSGSGGPGGLVKLQQQQQGQQGSGGTGSRSYGSGGSGAHGAPPQSPSHSAAAGPGTHGVGRAGEREGSTAGENGSSNESKFPKSRGSASAGAGAGAVSGGAGGIIVHGGAEYNLVVGLGKQAKSREQGQVKQGYTQVGSTSQQALQQKQQLQGSGGGGLVGGKGMDSATSQSFPMSLSSPSSRGPSVGPGPLGLASVAAVMAPQGHAMIQSMAESGRGQAVRSPQLQLGVGSGHSNMVQQQNQHQLLQLHQAQLHHVQSLQSHQQHPVPQQQQQQQQQYQLQQQRGGQNTRSAAGGAEDSRSGLDGSYGGGIGLGREREVVDDKKVHGRRPSGGTSPLSRDAEGGGGMQPLNSNAGAGDMGSSRSVETTLNLMASSNSTDARTSGQSVSGTVASPIQASVMAGSKQGGVRAKGAGGPTPAAPGGPQLATQGTFTERVSLAGGPGVGMPSPPQGMSLGGQSMASSQGGRQGQVGQHAQMKVSQRPAPGALSGATVVPTAPGTPLQAVLAAAMAKNSQGQQSQRTAPGGLNSNASANANSGSSTRMGTAMSGPPVSSAGSPMLSMAPPTKSSGANVAKSNPSAQSSFPLGQKGVAGAGKRASSPSSVGMVPSMLGPNISVQTMPSKASQPQVQGQGQGPGNGLHQHVGVQLLNSHQGQFPSQLQQQQFQQQQQQQMMRISMFQQNHAQQQSPHFPSSQPGSPHLQSPQQAPPHQQQAPQQQPTPPPQAQQSLSHQPNQQQQHGGPAGNGGLAFSSGLSMGAGNNSSAGGGRSSNSESGNVPPNVRPLQSVKPAGSGSTPGANGGGQRGNGGSGAGPAFLQQQFGSSVAASAGGQQSGSPRNSAAAGYGGVSANPGAGGRASDGKGFGDGGGEQVNGMRMAQGGAQGRGAGAMGSSPGMQGSSQRGQSGGGAGGGGGAGPTKAGPGGGGYNGFGEMGQSGSRSTMASNPSSGPQSGGSNSSGQMSSGGTNVQSVGNGRPAFNGGSMHGGGSGQGSVQAPASLGMAGAAVVASGPAAVLGPQPTTSVVQQ